MHLFYLLFITAKKQKVQQERIFTLFGLRGGERMELLYATCSVKRKQLHNNTITVGLELEISTNVRGLEGKCQVPVAGA